jgi:hypothetical protein
MKSWSFRADRYGLLRLTGVPRVMTLAVQSAPWFLGPWQPHALAAPTPPASIPGQTAGAGKST